MVDRKNKFRFDWEWRNWTVGVTWSKYGNFLVFTFGPLRFLRVGWADADDL